MFYFYFTHEKKTSSVQNILFWYTCLSGADAVVGRNCFTVRLVVIDADDGDAAANDRNKTTDNIARRLVHRL